MHVELLDVQLISCAISTVTKSLCGSYPPNPTREVGKLRLAAEKGWLQLGQSLGLSTKVFRLGGIYGPGRR